MKRTGWILLLCLFAGTSFAAKWKAKHVILIGLDGWGAYSVEKAEMPTTKEMMKNGACTLEKRSVLPSSSAVNWASMFMGAGPELHGYTEWGSRTPELPSREISRYGIFPTIFGLFRDANPKAEIGCIYEWEGIAYLIDRPALNYDKHVTEVKDDPGATARLAADYIRKARPNLLTVVFDNPDHVGHVSGHDTPEYYAVLKQLDAYIAQIRRAVEEAGMLDETIFILSADHGGIKKGHGGKTMQEMETPLIFCGKNVRSGVRIDDSVMQFDVASTLAYIFGLKQPQVWIGRPVKKAFR